MQHFHYRIGAAVLVTGGLFAGQAVGCVFKPELISLDDSDTKPPPPSCTPSEHPDTPVDASCGVFVSAATGDDTQAGTPDQPVKTLAHAIALAQGQTGRVYACAASFEEAVEAPAGISLFGGLNCASTSAGERWRYVGDLARTALTTKAEQIPLVLLGGFGATRIEDFQVTAQPAVNAGGSSIAAVVDGASATLVRCTFEAGDGRDGADGEAYVGAAQDGVQGEDGQEACSGIFIPGGAPVSSMCGDPDSVSGGGGDGDFDSGFNGGSGLPGTTTNGGLGEDSEPCDPGTAGDTGVAGTPGAGAMGLGTISRSGYAGLVGIAGTSGNPGRGGGGGGGAISQGKCPGPPISPKLHGASGASGGSGGCGGAGGKGGNPGGASIALISLKASLSLTDVTLRTGNGGNGGDGGPGQDGGIGALGGKGGSVDPTLGINPACDGGSGGSGGKGGPGGGGLGGHSIGLAYVGESVPAVEGVTFDKKGTVGIGGAGVDGAHSGAEGLQADVQLFL